MASVRLAATGERSTTVWELCHAAEARAGLRSGALVIETVQWGILCDELGRMASPTEYAMRYRTTAHEAERRLAEFHEALGLSPADLNDVQWDGARRGRGSELLDDVQIVYVPNG
jgi:hypothetical protein